MLKTLMNLTVWACVVGAASTALAQIAEKKLNDYLQSFPGTQKDLYFENSAPPVPKNQKGHLVLGQFKQVIYDKSEVAGLKDNDTFLMVGSAWMFFDAPLEVVHKYLSTVEHEEYPAPVTGTANVKRVNSEQQTYTAFLRNKVLGISVDQVCSALLSSRMLSADTAESVYQFVNCFEKGSTTKIWAHDSWNRDHLLSISHNGRRATLFLYQNFTVLERHSKLGVKLSKDQLLSVASSAAQSGFKTIMKSVPVQR